MRVRSLLFVWACSCLAACERPSAEGPTSRDAGVGLSSHVSAARIVSVGSAVTEAVYALGAGDLVAGVDTSSAFPEAASKLPQVGYQRALAAEGILALGPTIVLASAEAGPPAVLDQLRGAGVRLEIVPNDPSVSGARARILRVAELLGRDPSKVIMQLDRDLERAGALTARIKSRPKVLVLYARGAKTLHVFGRDTAAELMVRLAGGENAVTAFEGTKPLTGEALLQAAPEWIVLPTRGLESIGGLNALLEVPGIAATPAGKAKRIVAIDDLLLLGFGPRTGQGVIELCRKIHPELGQEEK